MKTTHYDVNKPKTKKAVIALLETLVTATAQKRKRRENLMISKSQTEAKLTKLQKNLDNIKEQIEAAEAAIDMNDNLIESLLAEWQLTESEILELKGEALRTQIRELEKQKILANKDTKLT